MSPPFPMGCHSPRPAAGPGAPATDWARAGCALIVAHAQRTAPIHQAGRGWRATTTDLTRPVLIGMRESRVTW